MNHVIRKMVAGALVLAGVQAAQADDTLATYDEASATQVTVLSSGATAQDPGIEKFFQLNQANNGLCVDGSLVLFRSSPDANGDIANRLFFCQGNPAIAAVAGKNLAFFKGSTGGSGNGVGPLVRPGPLPVALWLVNTGGSSMTCTNTQAVTPSGVSAAYTLKTACTNATANTSATRPLQGGFSDLEPARFASNFAPALTSAELGQLNVQQAATVIFGVPVSLNIRNRMQQVTFGAGSPCIGSEALNCQPSLTTEQLAAIYSRSGAYTSWAALKSKTASGSDVSNAGGALANNTIFICRRSNTSGTQATFQTHFFKQNCGIANSAAFAAIGGTVISNGGSPAVVSCLETRNTNNEGGIGILSTEFQPGPGAGWRFIKVNGAPPCLLDTVRGAYDLIGEATMQWPTAINAQPAGQVLLAVRSRLQTLAAVQDVNSTTTQLTMCAGGGGAPNRGFGALVAPFGSNAINAPAAPFCTNADCTVAPFNPATNDVQARPVLLASRNTTGPNSCSALRNVGNSELTVSSPPVD